MVSHTSDCGHTYPRTHQTSECGSWQGKRNGNPQTAGGYVNQDSRFERVLGPARQKNPATSFLCIFWTDSAREQPRHADEAVH